jgi:hypothetical protein
VSKDQYARYVAIRRYSWYWELTLDSKTDIYDDLNGHAAVCQLAELWGLPQGLREIAYQKYKAIAQDMCRSKDFAPSAENVTSQPFSM